MSWSKRGGSSSPPIKKTMKLLVIGNSFSIDSAHWLFDIAKSAGVNIVVGVAHGSGYSLEQHWEGIQNNVSITAYQKWDRVNGHVIQDSPLLKNIIPDENWDIITYQQASNNSGKYETFQPFLNDIHNFVSGIATNGSVRYGLNMTWPYASDRTNGYGTQEDMYVAVAGAYQQALEEMDFDILLPTGTAIQSARSNPYLQVVGNDLCRDTSHLDYGIGRYIAALTVFQTLFSSYYCKDVLSDVNFVPKDDGGTNFLAYLSRLVAKNAALNPFNLTGI